MKFALTTAALLAGVSAFPALSVPDETLEAAIEKRLPVRKHQKNSGFIPNTVFNAKEQYVDVRPGSGHHFTPPASTDIRGPCPGLNACANHKFISHTGILDHDDTVNGLFNGLGFGRDFSQILFVFAVFNSGSFVDEKWSIGGPMKTTTLGILGQGLGISNSHNKYEGDSSPGRGDAFLHHGDAHSLNIPNFQHLYSLANKDRYGFTELRRQVDYTHEFTLHNNPYAFFGPTFFVSPIAHQFIVAMMSNHSKTEVQGYLNKNILKSFFSVKEASDGSLTWVPGHDRIPDNWYRRPGNNPYDFFASFGDFGITCAQSPKICDVGGNLGKPNSFVGVEVEDFTGGVFNSKDLLKGNNLACLALEGATFVVPGAAAALAAKATKFTSFASGVLGKKKKALGCPQLTSYDMSKFKKFPGYMWNQPRQPATPY